MRQVDDKTKYANQEVKKTKVVTDFDRSMDRIINELKKDDGTPQIKHSNAETNITLEDSIKHYAFIDTSDKEPMPRKDENDDNTDADIDNKG